MSVKTYEVVIPCHVVVSLGAGMWPQSPSVRNATRPLGRITTCVILPLCREILSQASGGNCNALQLYTKKKIVNGNIIAIRIWITKCNVLSLTGCMKYAGHAGQVQRKFQMSSVAL